MELVIALKKKGIKIHIFSGNEILYLYSVHDKNTWDSPHFNLILRVNGTEDIEVKYPSDSPNDLAKQMTELLGLKFMTHINIKDRLNPKS